jgi:sulfhydrogenase subunit beta (sulfur reductase)
MEEQALYTEEKYTIGLDDLQRLFDALVQRGYLPVGPTVRDGAIVYDELSSINDLPIGWTDKQEASRYRLEKRNDDALFGYAVGQHSWKRYLHPPSASLLEGKRKGQGFQIASRNGEVPKYAFFGARPCEVRAIAILDEVFLNGEYTDPAYKARRENVFILAANCGVPGGTCFCFSLETGPKAPWGFELSLTEILGPDRHYFVVEVGSALGAEVLNEIPHNAAGEAEIEAADRVIAKATGNMGRILDTTDLKELLYDNYEHLQWDDIAERCLTCGSCTMVCPTCFCNTIEDYTDLQGNTVERRRRWDSCFTVDFTYIHGGSTRASPMSRYRQRLTHKLGTWQDQFGMIGCVGCGRCITWCPVGMDITEEVQAIRGIPAVCKTCVPSPEKTVETMRRILAEHPFMKEMGSQYLDVIAECSSIVRFNPGEFIFHTGEDADRFYLIRHGKVAVETLIPERGAVVVQTIGEGETLGWSWFVPPYKWHFDAQAIELTRAIVVEAQYLKDRIEKDPALGYAVERFFSKIIGQRMEATRMQLLDIYGDHG